MLTEKLSTIGFLTVRDIIGTRACAFIDRFYGKEIHPIGILYTEYVYGVAELLKSIEIDPVAISAAMIYPLLSIKAVSPDEIKKVFDDEILKLVEEVMNLEKLHWCLWSKDAEQGELQPPKKILRRMFNLITDEPEDEDQIQTSQKSAQFQNKEKQTENLIKMLLVATDDIRALIIMLAEHLYLMEQLNLSSLEFLQQEKVNLAKINLAIYAPIANRLGLWRLQSRLEDSAFQLLHLDIYEMIEKQLGDQDVGINEMVKIIRDELRRSGISAAISGREKHVYSIYQKMKAKQLKLEQINDLLGIRIIVEKKEDCYTAQRILHALWLPLTNFYNGETGRDWIKGPKANGYQSLHTTISFKNKVVEIQIRTQKMHEIAEYGTFAAHWRYKAEKTPKEVKANHRAWREQAAKLHKILLDQSEPFAQMQKSLLKDRIYVVTPKGHVIDLPIGSTALDLAYRIHTELGERCKGAVVDGRSVRIDHKLNNAEIVEILYLERPRSSYYFFS